MWIPGRLRFCWGNKIIEQLASGKRRPEMWIGRLFTRDSAVRRRAAALCHAERGPGLPSGWRVWSVVCGVRMGLKSRKTVKQPLLTMGEGRLLTNKAV